MFWGVGSNPTTGPLLHVFPHNLSPVSIKKRKRKLWPNCGCWDFCRPTDGETHRAADRSFPQLFLELLTPISHIICQTCQCGVNYLRSDVQLWREHLPSSPLNQSINVSHVALEHIRGLSPIKSFVFRDCLVLFPLTHITHLIRLMNTDFHKKTLKLSRSICFIVFGFGGCIFPSQLKSINYCVYERFFSDWLTIDEAQQWVLYR